MPMEEWPRTASVCPHVLDRYCNSAVTFRKCQDHPRAMTESFGQH